MNKELVNAALLARWENFLREIAAGTPLAQALLASSIKTGELDLITRTDPIQDQRWQEARLSGESAAWPALAFEEVCARISAGMTVNDAIIAVRGGPDPSFFRVIDGVPQRKSQFMAAMRSWTLVQAQELEKIADDTSRDVISGPKGDIPNMAAVQRDRLRTDMKKTLITAFNRELFGEQKNKVEVSVNMNLAERLERGIQNARDRKITLRQRSEAIDATFSSAAEFEKHEAEPSMPSIWNEEGAPKNKAQTKPADPDAETGGSEAEIKPWKCLEE